jgi:hypothetical protein
MVSITIKYKIVAVKMASCHDMKKGEI